MRILLASIALITLARPAAAQCAGAEVKLFELDRCSVCKQVDAFLRQHGIRPDRYDVVAERNQRYMQRWFGQVAAPITESNGRYVVGYNEAQLKKLLCK